MALCRLLLLDEGAEPATAVKAEPDTEAERVCMLCGCVSPSLFTRASSCIACRACADISPAAAAVAAATDKDAARGRFFECACWGYAGGAGRPNPPDTPAPICICVCICICIGARPCCSCCCCCCRCGSEKAADAVRAKADVGDKAAFGRGARDDTRAGCANERPGLAVGEVAVLRCTCTRHVSLEKQDKNIWKHTQARAHTQIHTYRFGRSHRCSLRSRAR